MTGLRMAPGWEQSLARESFAVREALIKAAEVAAVRACPVDTGRLARTITGEADRESMRMQLSAGDDGEVDYAADVELGTSHQQAQPFLRPALDQIGR
jgi:HK97 gp10 family phage protein